MLFSSFSGTTRERSLKTFALYKYLQHDVIFDLRYCIELWVEARDPTGERHIRGWSAAHDPTGEQTRAIQNNLDYCWSILEAIDEEYPKEDPKAAKHWNEVLQQCHTEYQQKQQDQDRLLADGSSVAGLAACASRMPRLWALSFSDRAYRPTAINYFADEPIAIKDLAKLHHLLVMSHDWDTVERYRITPGIHPTNLLWQVPIALCESGIQLREVAISTLSVVRDPKMLRPQGRGRTPEPAWGRLRDAFRHLCKVDVGRLVTRYSAWPGDLSADGKASMGGYLGALLSSPSLERLHLDATAYSSEHNEYRTDVPFIHMGCKIPSRHYPSRVALPDLMWKKEWGECLYAIGSVLAPVRCPKLRHLSLGRVSLRQQEFEAFIGGIGSQLQSIQINAVKVVDGTWESPLDLLRDKILLARRTLGADAAIDVCFACMAGEGRRPFNGEELGEWIWVWDWEAVPLHFDRLPDFSPLMRDTDSYVGETANAVNPFAHPFPLA